MLFGALLICSITYQAKAQKVFAGKVNFVSREYHSYPGTWAASQILGQPNVYPAYGDIGNNWTPLSYGDQRDTIDLQFDNTGAIDSIFIYQTDQPGFIDSVFVKNPGTGGWVLIYAAIPALSADSAQILAIGFPTTAFNVSEVRIMLATDLASSWVELDAVAISPSHNTGFVQSHSAGYALHFDGDSAYYRTYANDNNMLTDSAFTIAAWVKIGGAAPAPPTINEGAGIVSDGGDGVLGIYQANFGQDDSIFFYSNPDYINMAYTQGEWMHLTMTYTNDTLKAYKNGVLVGSVYSVAYWDGIGYPLELGRNDYNNSFFKGDIDELVTFNRAISAAEVVTVKNLQLTGTEQGLTGYWPFNDCDGSSHFNAFTHLRDSLVNGTSCVTADYVVPTGISNLETATAQLNVYPVPANDILNVVSADGISSIEIYDMLGRTIYQAEAENKNMVSINVKDFAKSVYLLKVITENGIATKKFNVE